MMTIEKDKSTVVGFVRVPGRTPLAISAATPLNR